MQKQWWCCQLLWRTTFCLRFPTDGAVRGAFVIQRQNRLGVAFSRCSKTKEPLRAHMYDRNFSLTYQPYPSVRVTAGSG